MPPYKNQHYLPSAYLKYFSADQRDCSRNSLIWRFDDKDIREVPVVSQCSTDYHYSKEKAAETEEKFQASESLYCQCVDGIKAGKTLSKTCYGNLLIVMFDFYLRNDVHKNLTGKEGIAAYHMRNQWFMIQTLLRRKAGDISKDEVIHHIEQNWTIQIFSSIPGRDFITSDNPSVWTCFLPLSHAVHMVSLPLTPHHLAVAFDRRFLRVVGNQITQKDLDTLNCGQIQNAGRCIYTSRPLTDNDMVTIKDIWSKITRTKGEVREGSWRFPIQGLLPKNYFSFVRLNPPLY